MKPNMGTTDKVLRVIVAAVVASLCVNGPISGVTGIILLILSVIFVATSLISFCPLYLPFGIKTV